MSNASSFRSFALKNKTKQMHCRRKETDWEATTNTRVSFILGENKKQKQKKKKKRKHALASSIPDLFLLADTWMRSLGGPFDLDYHRQGTSLSRWRYGQRLLLQYHPANATIDTISIYRPVVGVGGVVGRVGLFRRRPATVASTSYGVAQGTR